MKHILFLLAIISVLNVSADTLQDCMLTQRVMTPTERANHNESCYRQHVGFLHSLFGDINAESAVYLNSSDQEEAVRLGLDAGLSCSRGTPELVRRKIPNCIAKQSFIQSSRNPNHYRCKLADNEYLFAYINEGEVTKLTLISGARPQIVADCSR